MKSRIILTLMVTVTVFFLMAVSQISAEAKGKPKVRDKELQAATAVMKNVRQLANVFEEGGHLVVEFHTYIFPNDINKRLQFVRAVADADCVLTGKPRLIFFYNPGGKEMAKASPTYGIQLKE